jgi:hypothetical protein
MAGFPPARMRRHGRNSFAKRSRCCAAPKPNHRICRSGPGPRSHRQADCRAAARQARARAVAALKDQRRVTRSVIIVSAPRVPPWAVPLRCASRNQSPACICPQLRKLAPADSAALLNALSQLACRAQGERVGGANKTSSNNRASRAKLPYWLLLPIRHWLKLQVIAAP